MDRDHIVRLHAVLAQLCGQPVGALVELAVGELPRAVLGGQRVGAQASLLLDELVRAAPRRVPRFGSIPDHNHLLALRGGQQRQIAQFDARIARHTFEQHLQMASHAADDVLGKTPPRVLELEEQLLVAVRSERERIVGIADIAEAPGAPGLAKGAQLRIERALSEDEQGLEERRAARHLAPALHVHERGVLVIAQRELRLALRLEPGAKLGLGVDTHARGHRIDERAHDAGGALERRGPTRARHAEYHVVLAAVAVQEERPCGLQEHVEGDARSARAPAQGGGERGGQPRLMGPINGVPAPD